MTPVELVLSRLGAVRPIGDGFIGSCPAHDDRKPSLAISEGHDGRALLHCHASCSTEQVLAALDLRVEDLFPPREHRNDSSKREVAAYPYTDETGELLYEVVRFAPKDFRQRRPDGRGGWIWKLGDTRRVLYRLPQILEGARSGRWVFVVEGEKDADRLAALGLIATCNPGGAGKWRPEYAETFRGAKVAVLRDNDTPGRGHAQSVAESVRGVAKDVRVVELPGLPEHGDVSDWLEAGGTVEQLERLILAAGTKPELNSEAGNSTPVPPSEVITRLDQVRLERVEWLWPGRLPLGKLVVLDGDPGTGKSTLAIGLAARVTTGSPMPDRAVLPRPASVVVLTAEDGLGDTVRPRLEAARGDAAKVHVLEAVRESDGTERPPRIPEDLARLEALVRRLGAKLVIVDVLAAYLSGQVDSYRDADVRRALHPLARLAEETGAVVLVLRHLSKSGGTNALYRGGGSIGIIGAARVGLLAAIDPEDEGRRVLAVTKSNLAAIPTALAYRLVPDEQHDCARVEWLGATAHQPSDLLVVRDSEERSEQDEAKDWLVDYLKAEGGRAFAREVKKAARDAGIAERTLTRARQRARVTTRRAGFGAGFVWDLPHSGHHGPHSGHSSHLPARGLDGLDGLDAEGEGPDGPSEHDAGDLGAWVSQSDLDELAAHERARERAVEGLDN
jgi:putative DNA primase/helicase